MKKLSGIVLLIMCFAIIVLPSPGIAFEYSGSLTSLARMWTLDRSYIDEDDLFRFRLYEYLHLYVEESDKYNISIPLYVRGIFDLGKEGDSTGDLLYGYLEWKNRSENLVIKAGRQLNFHTAFPVFFDGAQVSWRFREAYTAEVFGGVNFYPDRDWSGDDTVIGVRGGYEKYEWFHAGVSFMQSYRDSTPEHSALGFEFIIKPVSQFEVNGHLFYDFLFDNYYDAALNISGDYQQRFFYGFNYQRYIPSGFLPATSIFTVFSFESVQQYEAQMEMKLNDWIRTFLEYSYQDFDVDSSNSFELSVRAYPKNLALDYISAGYNHESGYAGKFQDVFLKGRIALNPRLSFISRLTLYLYNNKAEDRIFLPEYSLDPVDAETLYESTRRDNSFTVYVISQYRFTDHLVATAGIDYSRTPYLNHDWRGTLKVTYRFWSPVRVDGGDSE